HVDAGAAPGGDGSAERPYRDPADALAMARPAGAVLLRAGTYALPAHLTLEAQTVVGACSERSILQTSGDALIIDASQASLRDLTLPPTHLQSGALTVARVEGTALDRALEVDAGARLTAERLLIRGGAEGIVVQAGAEVTLEDVALEDLTGDGLRLLGGATAGARIVIRRLPASAALRVSGAQATLQSLDVADTAAPVVLSDGAEARLDGVVLTRTTRDTGVGFLATDSELTLSRALVYNLRGQSFDLREGTRASIQDLVVLDNVPVHHRETIELGRACQLDLTRAFIREDHEGVVRTSDEDTRAVALTDVRIQARHVAPEVSTVVLIESGSLLMRRVRIEGGASDSVDVRTTPQPVVLEDLDLEGGKIGVTVDPGVDVTGSRVRARGQLQDGLLFTGFGEVADTLQLLDAEVSGS
ncbi:MAG: hypothetical protein KC933_40855, partial [Myxococcales bacterium]|nr:hypothetical protein [Myxococcales bacterium]